MVVGHSVLQTHFLVFKVLIAFEVFGRSVVLSFAFFTTV